MLMLAYQISLMNTTGVNRETRMAEANNALLSVYNKEGILDFAEGLKDLGWNIYASGGTATQLSRGGVRVTDVAELVGGDAILEHRVVTLSREIHAGLLADTRNDMHVEELERLGIPLLGAVCVDMYPLKSVVASGATEPEVIEKTDVGGPTMLHSAAKGRRIVLSQQQQRKPVLEWLKEGKPDEENVLRALAAVAEQEVASYVGESAKYLGELALSREPQSSYAAFLRQGIKTDRKSQAEPVNLQNILAS
jgi:phosphoribosylaminoimidazolecarboxamide formyltransferase/IMP cyclohydrolase